MDSVNDLEQFEDESAFQLIFALHHFIVVTFTELLHNTRC
jgi:hypothetical protein